MTDNQNEKYVFYTKVAWAIYILITIALIAVLALIVARDNEEMLFYSLMAAAVSYIFRPHDAPFSKLMFKLTGVSKPTEEE